MLPILSSCSDHHERLHFATHRLLSNPPGGAGKTPLPELAEASRVCSTPNRFDATPLFLKVSVWRKEREEKNTINFGYRIRGYGAKASPVKTTLQLQP
jgi:hypothetical protein